MIYSAKNNNSGNDGTNPMPEFNLSNSEPGAADSAQFFSPDSSINNTEQFMPAFNSPSGDDSTAYSQDDHTFADNLRPMEYLDGSKSIPSGKQKKKLIKPWGYFGLLILFSIPVVGLVFLIIFACSNKDKNRKNFAGGFLLYWIASVLLVVGATTFLIIQLIAPLFPNGFKLDQVLSAISNSQNETLSADQIAAITSGDFSALTPEQVATIDNLFTNADQSVIDDYFAAPPLAYEAMIITNLPSSLPDTFSGKPISSFVLDEVSYFTVIDVTSAQLEDFKKGLLVNMNEEGIDEISSLYTNPTSKQNIKLDYAEDDRMLTILVYPEQA